MRKINLPNEKCLFLRLLSIIAFIFFTVFLNQTLYAVNAPSADSGADQNEQSFPFDKQCLKFDKANFKVGQALLDVMTAGDFPQYCVLYSLSNYLVKKKRDEGYFIISSKADQHQAEATIVFLKSNIPYQQGQILSGLDPGAQKPVGRWAFFAGIERFVLENGSEKEFYVFQEIDF